MARWREDGYPGASDVTQRLFGYWFEDDHEVTGFSVPFRYHFCQREAIETLVYLVEVAQIRDAKALIDAYAEVFRRDLISASLAYQTTMDGRRQLRRYVPELDAEGVQDLPLRIFGIHRALPHGLALWLDFSATPRTRADISSRLALAHPLGHVGPLYLMAF